MRKELVLGSNQANVMESIRVSILNSSDPIRVIGDPGVGKTRLVMEALKDVRFSSSVIYAAKPSDLPQGFLRNLTLCDNAEQCILVVDECSAVMFHDIWDQISCVSDRVKLVTIYNEVESAGSGPIESRRIEIPPLLPEDISKILISYGLTANDAFRLAGLCSGSPRVAHIVGEQVRISGTINITSHENMWARYIAGVDEVGSESYKKRLRVLEWLSLFVRFGYDGSVAAEGSQIIRKITHETQMSEVEIREIINELRNKKILQGDYTLYITPKLLHLWLWGSWWKKYGSLFDWNSFMTINESEHFCDSLVGWFIEMLQYASESETASNVISGLIGDNGPFVDDGFIASNHGFKLLLSIAKVNPDVALDYVETYLKNKSKNELLALHDERQCLIEVLKCTAYEIRLFERSARCLFRLACAENESWSNNATGSFAELFSNGYGGVAPSKATPSQRLIVLQKIALCESDNAQNIVICAIDKALKVRTGRLVVALEVDLLHTPLSGWMPKTYDELFNAYRDAWKLAMDCLQTYNADNRKKLASVMQERAISLITFINDGSEVVGWLRDLRNTGLVDDKKLVNSIANKLRYSKKLTDNTRELLESFKNDIVGTTYESRLHRYAGIRVWDEDYDKTGNEPDFISNEFNKLAEESIGKPNDFKRELPWLISKEPENAFRFGLALGEKDNLGSLWLIICEAYQNALSENRSCSLCSGYLKSIFLTDSALWSERINDLQNSDKLIELFPAVISDAGLSDELLFAVASKFTSGKLSAESLAPLAFCRQLYNVEDDCFCAFLRALLNDNSARALQIAVDVSYRRVNSGKKIPAALQASVINQPILMTEKQITLRNSAYTWYALGKDFLKTYSGSADKVVGSIVAALGNDVIETTYLADLLHDVVKLVPETTWAAIGERLLNEGWVFSAAFYNDELKRSLSGLPCDVVISWIKIDPTQRAYLAMSMFPAVLYDDAVNATITREILAKYGDQDQVQRTIDANVHSYSWSGSHVDVLNRKINILKEYRNMESNPYVLEYIDRTIRSFEITRNRDYILEERCEW